MFRLGLFSKLAQVLRGTPVHNMACAAIAEGEPLHYKERTYRDVTGIFAENKKADDAQDDRDEEDSIEESIHDLNSSEIKKLKQGAKLLEANTPKVLKGTLHDPTHGRTNQLKAKIHLEGSWWIVRLLRTKKDDGFIVPMDDKATSYELIRDEGLAKRYRLVYMLLSDRKQDNSVALNKFEEFVRHENEELRFDYNHLLDLTNRFLEYLPDEDKGLVYQISPRLHGIDGLLIKRAQEFPDLFRYLPQLMPKHFVPIVAVRAEEEHILHGLDYALKHEPWVFAFKKILVKVYSVMGVEVSMENLKKCGIFAAIPEVYQQAIEIYTYIKTKSNSKGNTCLHLNNEYHFDQLLRPMNNEGKAAMKYLLDTKILIQERFAHKTWTFLYHLWKSEVDIARGLNELFKKHVNNPEKLNIDLDDSPSFENIRTDGDQLRAAKFIQNKPVVVISGKGGCGKTTVVTKVITEIYNVSSTTDSVVLFTAPTGKAAKLLGRKAGTDGYTLHQIMYSYRAHLKHNPDKIWKFSSVEVLIVDECSMVAVEIFASLLKVLLENTDLKRVVFLGDVRQLPSVQPGNFLQDIFSTFLLNPACSIELKTNHRAESELIIQNATRISQRKLPEFDDKRNYKFHPVVANEGCQYESFEQVLRKMLKSEEDMKDHTTSHIVAFTRVICESVNRLAIDYYNPDAQGNPRELSKYRIGDKVGLFRNGWVRIFKMENSKILPVYIDEDEEENIQPTQISAFAESPCKGGTALEPEDQEDDVLLPCHSGDCDDKDSKKPKKEREQKMLRLCNGEIYFIKDDHEVIIGRSRRRYLKLSDEDPESPLEIYVQYSQLIGECKMQHAWAKTIHTFQGSECDTIAYVVGNISLENWSHVYTAVTRGRRAIHVVGEFDCLEKAVKENIKHTRDTGLAFQLKKEITTAVKDSLRDIGSTVKPKLVQKSIGCYLGVNGTKLPGTADQTDDSTLYTITTPKKSNSTPSISVLYSQDPARNGEISRLSSHHRKFNDSESDQNRRLGASHVLPIQSPAKSRLFKDTEPSMSTLSLCKCRDFHSCICGITPIPSTSCSPNKIVSPEIPSLEIPSFDNDNEINLFDSPWSDISNTEELFNAEDQLMWENGECYDGDSDETLDDLDFANRFPEIKPNPSVAASSSSINSDGSSSSLLTVNDKVGPRLTGPSPKRLADWELEVTPAKQRCLPNSHTGITPAFKKLDF